MREKKRTPRFETIKSRCASGRKLFESGEAFFLSLLLRAVAQLPKIFSLGERHAFEIRFFRHGKKHCTRTAVFCNHDGFFRWQFLNDLAQLGLNFAQAFDLHNSNSFPPINKTLPFLRPTSSTITTFFCSVRTRSKVGGRGYFGLIPNSFCASLRIDKSAISLRGISRSIFAVFFASSTISRRPASGSAPSSLNTLMALS